MEDLEFYKNHINKWLFCIRSDKGFGIKKSKGYRIKDVEENDGQIFYKIETDKFPDGIAFKLDSNSFLSVEESLSKLRELKLGRVVSSNDKENESYGR